MKRTPAAPGFTLIELMTSVVVMVLVLAAVAATFAAVQRTYQLQAQVKSAVEGGRASSTYLSRELRMASYGIDPAYAFDLQTGGLPGALKDNAVGTIAGTPGFVTDDLAFRWRDPAWLRRGSLNAGGTSLTLDGGAQFGIALTVGQPLIISCKGARQSWVAFTTAAAAATASTVGVQPATVPPFDTGPYSASLPCMKGVAGPSAAYVMLMHQERIRVVDLGSRPYLVVFHNLAAPDPATNLDFDPIAADVENFQVAYVMNRPIPGGQWTTLAPVDSASSGAQNPNWVLGDSGSAAAEVLPDRTSAAPTQDMGYDAQTRYSNHPGNIRAVRLNVVLRSTRPLAGRQSNGVVKYDVENWTAPVTPVLDGYYRTSSVTTVRIPNMASRSSFNPMNVESFGDDPNLNTGGS